MSKRVDNRTRGSLSEGSRIAEQSRVRDENRRKVSNAREGGNGVDRSKCGCHGRMLTLAFALAVGERWGGAAATSLAEIGGRLMLP